MHLASAYTSNMALTFVVNVSIAALGLITGPMVARLLGPGGRGELAAIQYWPTFLVSAVSIGVPEALVYYCSKDPQRAGRYLGSALTMVLALMAPVLAAAYLLMPVLLHAQPWHVIAAARWYLLMAPVFVLTFFPLHTLRSRPSLLAWNALRIPLNIGWLMVLIFAYLWKARSAEWLARNYLIVQVLLILPVLVGVISLLRSRLKLDPQVVSPLVRYGFPTAGARWSQLLRHQCDRLIIAAYLGPAALGFYAVALAWGAATAPFINAVVSVTFSRLAAEADERNAFAALARAARVTLALCFVGGIMLALAAPLALPKLFGAAFREAVLPAAILALAVSIIGAYAVLADGLRARGKVKLVLHCELLGLALGIAGIFLVVRKFGVPGIAFSVFFSYAVSHLVLAINAARLTGTPVTSFLVLQRRDIADLRASLTAWLRASGSAESGSATPVNAPQAS
jgi:O-antigen/teichoic acid export membrane protein